MVTSAVASEVRSNVARYPGKVSPRKAARMMGVHVHTVYAACRAAEQGQPTLLRNVSRASNGYLLLDKDEVTKARDYGESEDY